MDNFFAAYPVEGGGSSSVVTIYANVASFPVSAPIGSLAVDASTGNLFEFNGTSWVQIAGPSLVAGGVTIDRFTLSPTDITNKFVTLTATPSIPTSTLLTVINGPLQDYGVDYTVSGATLSWAGLWLDGVLVAGDKLVIQFS